VDGKRFCLRTKPSLISFFPFKVILDFREEFSSNLMLDPNLNREVDETLSNE